MDSNHVPPRYLALSAAPKISGNSTSKSAAAGVMWYPYGVPTSAMDRANDTVGRWREEIAEGADEAI